MADTRDHDHRHEHEHDHDDHAHPAAGVGELGIPRCGSFDGVAFEQAIAD